MEKTRQKQSHDMQKNTQDFYKSFFYIGWRPTIFWIIVFSAMHSFLIRPIVSTIMFVYDGTVVPSMDSSTIVSLVALVLGGTAIRGLEKIGKELF